MKHLSVPNDPIFPAIEEETTGTPEQRERLRQPADSFTTITSDEIGPAQLSADDEESSDDEPLIVKRQKMVPYAPDGGYGWVIVFAAFLSNFVLDGISVSQSALMEDIRKASGVVKNGTCAPGQVQDDDCTPTVYEISVAMYGLISSVLFCVTLVAGPFISLGVERYGFRKVAVSGSLLASLGLFSSWVAARGKPNIWATIGCFGGISGLGFGMMFQPSIIIVGMYFEKWRPLANGLAMMGTGCGTIIFPPLLAYISKTWSWKEAYLFQAGVALFSATFALLYIPVPKRPSNYGYSTNKIESAGGSGSGRVRPEIIVSEITTSVEEQFGLDSMRKSMSSLLASPTFLLISIAGAITMLGFFGPYAFLVDRAMKEISGVNERDATFLLSIIGIANTSGRLIFGLISCHPWVNSLILSNAALTFGGLAIMAIPLTTAYYQLIIICVIFGFAIAIFTVLRSIIVLNLMGLDKFNVAFGLSLLFMGIGTLIGNPLGGWLKDSTGNYDISFYAAGGYLLLSGILCYPLQRLRDWENRWTTTRVTVPHMARLELDQEKFVQRRYSLSMSLHL